jgi:hypothetical protein
MREYYGTKIDPSLLLVKDEGIYLMSAGSPAQPDPDLTKPGQTRLLVQYAEGYDPTKRDRGEVWDDSYQVSRDDFSEPLPLGFFQRAVVEGRTEIRIILTEDEYKLEAL